MQESDIMRNLRKGIPNNKTEVKFLQAWLNQFCGAGLSVDGGYGAKTAEAVRTYQSRNKLTADGKAGQQTLNSMGFRTTANKNIVVLEIPFAKIAKGNVLLEEGKAFSCQKFAQKGYDIVWNGAFFGRSNYKVCTFVALAGKWRCYGNADSGIAYPNDWGKTLPMPMTRNGISGKSYDMQVGAPVLIQHGIADIDQTGIPNATMTAKTKRNCTAITDSSILLFFSIGNLTLKDMQKEGLAQKVTFMQGNDGGGSQSLYMGGAYVITTDGRGIPAAVGLKVK